MSKFLFLFCILIIEKKIDFAKGEEIMMWYDRLNWLENLPEEPSKTNLEKVVNVARKGHHWINRWTALNILGRTEYKPFVIKEISEKEVHPFIKQDAKKWLDDYNEEMVEMNNEKEDYNPFGNTWGTIKQPVIAEIEAIDYDVENFAENRIGMSAMQMDNLDLTETNPLLLLNWKGYDDIKMNINGKNFNVEIYNAYGDEALPGDGIRISKKLSRKLGVSIDDKIELYVVREK